VLAASLFVWLLARARALLYVKEFELYKFQPRIVYGLPEPTALHAVQLLVIVCYADTALSKFNFHDATSLDMNTRL
jgi:hypothetical protein